MEPLALVEAVATILWCHVLVLTVAWFRAVAREELQTHVAHFTTLMGVMVPIVSGFLAVVFLGKILGLPSVVVLLAVIVPAGLVVALQLEVSRLAPSAVSAEIWRLTLALGLGLAVIWRRQIA